MMQKLKCKKIMYKKKDGVKEKRCKNKKSVKNRI